MSHRTRKARREAIVIPATYVAPLRRPDELADLSGAIAWDRMDCWITAPEWLAWLRRRKKPYHCFGHHTSGKWVPFPRPEISATVSPQSNLRCGEIP